MTLVVDHAGLPSEVRRRRKKKKRGERFSSAMVLIGERSLLLGVALFRNLVDQATTDSKDPTSGFVYAEINS